MVSTFTLNLIFWLLMLPAGSPVNGQGQSYAQTRSPHGNLNLPCQNCHTSLGWKPIRAVPEFDHSKTRFPLRGLHEGVPCTGCHTKPVFTNVGTQCADCHADIHRRQMGARCEQCHTVNGWKVAVQDIQNHQNRFPLIGAHAAVECDACHKSGAQGIFTGLSTDCYSCHANDFNKTVNPNHAASKFSTNCQTCHSVNNWLNAKFDHAASGFPLTGMHATVACASCHVNNNYNLTAANTACSSCHLADFQKASNPVHTGPAFSQNCQQCHTTNGWSPATFDHSTVGFALTGFHANPSVTCAMCHVNNNYKLSNTACVGCHQQDYNSATSPVNHVQLGFPTTCQQCHDTTAWTNAKFDHATTGWPLTGFHLTSTQCSQCHTNNNYSLTAANTACVGCHQTDYNNATTPVNHLQLAFPTTCQQCHDTTTWTNAKFDHSTTGWPLTGFHLTSTQCAQCHVNNNYNLTAADTACVNCHQQDFNTATTPINHVQAGFPTTCQQCHDTVLWTDGKFDHSSTGWALTGFHLTGTQCNQCHTNNNYNLTTANTVCVGCHQTDYNGTTNPNHAASGIATTCEVCHNTGAWQPAQFDHSKSGFPLTGYHANPAVTCVMCHVNNNYNITNTSCVSCHQTDYNNATTPVNHIQLGFPTTCQQCHDTVLWTDGKFDHSTTGWPLTGFHLTSTQCAQCHINNNYNLTSANTTCVGCHQTDYNNATTPVNHVQLGFPTTCQQCHDTVLWTDGTFDHSTTGWPLTGFHLTSTQCAQCHINNNYNLTSANTTCVGCHQTDYNTATTPVNHVQLGFPTTCQQCHDTVLWTDGKFDHSTTGWPLTGFHLTSTQCGQCHINNNYNLTSANTTCVGCHQTDYNTATTPINHVQLGFPTTCQQCHDTVLWTDGVFDHSTTGWPLTGFHLTSTQCNQCHINNNYNLTSANTACVGCHQSDYNTATTPVNHIQLGFPTTCQQCHDTVLWTDGKFDHSTTGWPLTGFHLTSTQCGQCHINNNYNLTSANTACVSCHQSDYNTATTPVNHIAAGFPTTCSLCHDTVLWTDGTFDHSTTGWPLTGFHLTSTQCAQCHVNNNYKLNNTACVACHQTDYNTAITPVNHIAAGFPTTCQICHDTVLWTDGTFNHNNTPFPLTGFHALPPPQMTCAMCHVNNNYTTIPTDCYSCHVNDYNGTTSPNHKSAGFPTTCATCHTTTSWLGATFNHTWFPTNHGNANGVCATCHTNPNDYTVFQCTNCHQKTSTDQNHQGVNGYVYNSVNCYNCHKNGGGG